MSSPTLAKAAKNAIDAVSAADVHNNAEGKTHKKEPQTNTKAEGDKKAEAENVHAATAGFQQIVRSKLSHLAQCPQQYQFVPV